MRPKIPLLLILLGAFCAVASRASSAPLLFEFEATVTETCDIESHCGWRTSPVSANEVVTGWFSYDPDTPPSEVHEDTSVYPFEFPLVIQLRVAGTEVLTNDYGIHITDGSSLDQMLLRGAPLGGSIPLDLEHIIISIFLMDESRTVFSDTSLPTDIVLADFTATSLEFLGLNRFDDVMWAFSADITSLTLVPDPGSLYLALVGVACMCALRRATSKHQ